MIGVSILRRRIDEPSPFSESIRRWRLVKEHSHEWQAAIWFPPSHVLLPSGSSPGNGREIQKTAMSPEVGIFIDALSAATEIELRAAVVRIALDSEKSKYARFAASLMPEEIRNDPVETAKWVTAQSDRLWEALDPQ